MKEPLPAPLRGALTLVALGFLAFGQVTLFSLPEHIYFPSREGLIFLSLGLLVFALSLSLPGDKLPVWFKGPWPLRSASAWLLSAIFLELVTIYMAAVFANRALFIFIPVVVFWLLGAGAYLMIFAPPVSLRFPGREWWRAHRLEGLLLLLIFVLGVGLRFYKLGELPRIINGDEARIGLLALQTRQSEFTNPFALWENIGALYLQAINLVFDLFGRTPFAVRLLPALAGSLSILATYLLARHIGGRRVGLMTTFFLAFSHTHLHFSRTAAVSYIQGNWLVPLEMYFLLSGVEKRSSWRTALAGILTAIHFSVYLSAQLSLGVMALYLLLAVLFLRGRNRPQGAQIVAFLGGVALILLPEVSYAFAHPEAFFDRLNFNGAQGSGWLQTEMLLTGKSVGQIWAERITHVFLSFIHYPAVEFYGSSVPVLSMFTAIFFLLGLVYVLGYLRTRGYLLLNGYFWGVVISLGLFAIPAEADSYRVLMALPAAFIIASLGLDQVLQRLGLGWTQAPKRYAALVSLLLFSVFFFNLWVYFIDFAGRCRYGSDPETRFASYLGQYVSQVDHTSSVYLLSDEIFFYGSHASPDFLTNFRPIENFPAPVDAFSPLGGETLIASPARQAELFQWAKEHPGGHLDFEYDCDNLLLLAYKLP